MRESVHIPALNVMKKILLCCVITIVCSQFVSGQSTNPSAEDQKALTALIEQYSQARENKDTVLLKKILTTDVDQLVSTGEWRDGIKTAVDGMIKSSATSPGTRTLRVEKIKMLTSTSAIVDCRYEIKNPDGTDRKMWSTFIVVGNKNTWKISAIRNMLPSSS